MYLCLSDMLTDIDTALKNSKYETLRLKVASLADQEVASIYQSHRNYLGINIKQTEKKMYP